MLRSKNGERLYRRVEVKVFFPKDTIPNAHLIHKSGPKQGFSSENIDDILMQTADRLDQLYPWWDFKMTPLASSGRTVQYNFSVVGFRAVPEICPLENNSKNEESSTSSSEVTESNPQITNPALVEGAAI